MGLVPKFRVIAATFLLVASPTFLSAETLLVPADYPTIQAAIDAAADGDTVLVSPGTYDLINFIGKAITVESTDGPDVTVIDGLGAVMAVVFNNGETRDSVLTGFTITNGLGVFTGGGIVCIGASPTVTDCRIVANHANGDGGGGFCVSGSGPTFLRCEFRDNTCNDAGAGLFCSDSSPTFVECSFIGNLATSLLTTNGGGLYFQNGSTVLITRCVIAGNQANQGGGGIRCAAASAVITDSLIVGNTSGMGGGLRATDSSMVITNCTIVGNSATILGGGLDAETSPETTVTNCIVWGNSAPMGAQLSGGAPELSVTYCCVEGGWLGFENFNTAPQFVDEVGADGQLFTGDEDLRLLVTSPCLDIGNNNAPSIAAHDFFGGSRIVDGDLNGISTVDLGAHEFTSGFQRGDANADGAFDVSDPVFALAALFIPGSPEPDCLDAADANDDGTFDVSDPVYVLAALFIPGSPLPLPPGSTDCGSDPSPDSLDCGNYAACP